MKTRTISFEKNGHTYVFRYRHDMQNELIDHIMGLAESNEHGLDWLDAATLSFQVAQRAALGDIDTVTPPIKQK